MVIRAGYFLKRALRNMRQSPVLSLASIGTVAVSLALVAFFVIAVLNVQQLTSSWGKELMIVAYLDDVPDFENLLGPPFHRDTDHGPCHFLQGAESCRV